MFKGFTNQEVELIFERSLLLRPLFNDNVSCIRHCKKQQIKDKFSIDWLSTPKYKKDDVENCESHYATFKRLNKINSEAIHETHCKSKALHKQNYRLGIGFTKITNCFMSEDTKSALRNKCSNELVSFHYGVLMTINSHLEVLGALKQHNPTRNDAIADCVKVT